MSFLSVFMAILWTVADFLEHGTARNQHLQTMFGVLAVARHCAIKNGLLPTSSRMESPASGELFSREL